MISAPGATWFNKETNQGAEEGSRRFGAGAQVFRCKALEPRCQWALHLVYSSGHRFSGQALKSVNLLCVSHVTLTGCFYYYCLKYYSLAAFDL